MAPLTSVEMLADLSAVFPALWKRPLREYGPQWSQSEGVWTGEDGAHVMPDGLPIFSTVSGVRSHRKYVGGTTHREFESWLASRGWHAEQHDPDTFFLVPKPEAANAERSN